MIRALPNNPHIPRCHRLFQSLIRLPDVAPVRAPTRKPLECLDPVDDPLNEQEGSLDPQESVKVELTDLQRGFRERMAAEQARYKATTDLSYYFTVCFESGPQADAFLAYFGIGRGEGSLFIDGRPLADKLGIDLPASNLVPPKNHSNKTLAALSRRPGRID